MDGNLSNPTESEIKSMETLQTETSQHENTSAIDTAVIPSASVLSAVNMDNTQLPSEILQEAMSEHFVSKEEEMQKRTTPLPEDVKNIPMDTMSSTMVTESSMIGSEKLIKKAMSSQISNSSILENTVSSHSAGTLTVSSSSSSIPLTMQVTVQSQPKSIFSSLFPTPVPPVSKAADVIKSEKPSSPSISASLSIPPAVSESQKESKQVKGEASMEVQPPSESVRKSSPVPAVVKTITPVEIVAEPKAKTASSLTVEQIVASPTTTITEQGEEKMETQTVPVPVAETAKVVDSPNITAAQDLTVVTKEIKPEVKQPPIATKTMKRDQRKTSTTSPTGGEPRKAQRSKSSSTSPGGSRPKKKRPPPKEMDNRNDFYCWVCHKEGEVLCCELCPRVFHAKCLNMTEEPEGDWFCPECEKITEAECKETQSRAMSLLTIDQFSLLLKYVIQRMKLPMSEPFHEPVDTKIFTDYHDYVFHPMDLSTIEKNVKKRKYGCPEAFLLEFKWVIHNCIIYNSQQSKLTQTAKAMLKVGERELNEIEVCPECYLNSCRKRENWFCEPCKELHPLVWAKLQGFPHWPAKALRIEKGLVDVRFFGQHDRAWIPLSGCYLISKELPLPVKNKKKNKGPGMKGGLDFAMQEMQGYIDNIRKITGEFEYAPPRTLLTHCDLYRKTAASIQSGKQHAETEGKLGSGPPTAKTDSGSGIKAKVELKDIGGKDPIKLKGSTTPKKGKMVTTSGEHPGRPFATKKKKASMEFLNKTIESCKASLGIEKIQDVKMNSGSEETSSSSDDDENNNDGAKEKVDDAATKTTKDATSVSSTTKPSAVEDDDSDAELVIDLGDMDDSHNADPNKAAEGKSDEAAKKRKNDDGSKPLKSILLNTSKPVEREDRKKMLAKALSEKIATGKRKHGIEDSPSGASPSTKIRKTHDEKRSGSPVEYSQKLSSGKSGLKEKEKKKSHSGKYLDKDGSGKVKTGILKSSDGGLQRKDSYSEKRLSDSSKHKHKDGTQKITSKKPPDKSGKLDKAYVPTGADARKLFNGGRIPRKNPATTNISDEEHNLGNKDAHDEHNMESNQPIEPRRRSIDHPSSNLHSNGPRHGGVNRQVSNDPSRKNMDENTAMANLKKYSDKVMDTVQKVFYEMYTDMMVPMRNAESSNAATATAMHEVAQMRLELERLKWMHEQEIAELKHNHDLTVAEIRQSLEYEKKQLLLDAKVQAEEAKVRAVDEAKRKQWCAYCNKEAIFYCCWNTSYCDYPCQQKHWPQHMNTCTQARDSGGASAGGSQVTAMETSSSTPSSLSLSSKPSSLNTTSSALPQIPKSTTLLSPGRATITISASPGHLGRLTSGTAIKQAIILPQSVTVSRPSFTPVDKIPLKTSSEAKSKSNPPTTVESSDKSSVTSQQKSGFAISAIGARLLAAKQKTNIKDAAVTKSVTKTVTSKRDSPVFSVTETPKTSSEHVKTTLDSPLSPGAEPQPTKSLVSSLVTTSETSQKHEKSEIIKDDTEKTSAKETKVLKQKTDISEKESTSFFTSQPSAEPKSELTTIPKSLSSVPVSVASKSQEKVKAVSKPHPAIFSSPSAVANLIADMGTPLSSTLSSPESSSFSDTPEKKPDVSKVQLSLAGSAFTKVVPDSSSKPTLIQGTSSNSSKEEKSSIIMPATLKISSETSDESSTTFKPIDDKSVTDSTKLKEMEKPPEAVPIVAPVLADSYLSSLQKTLVKKISTSPVISEAISATPGDSSNTETKKIPVEEPMEVDSNG